MSLKTGNRKSDILEINNASTTLSFSPTFRMKDPCSVQAMPTFSNHFLTVNYQWYELVSI